MENLFPSLPHKKPPHGFFTVGLYDQVTKGPEEAEAACETCQVRGGLESTPSLWRLQRVNWQVVLGKFESLGIQSPKLRMVMEPKYHPLRR